MLIDVKILRAMWYKYLFLRGHFWAQKSWSTKGYVLLQCIIFLQHGKSICINHSLWIKTRFVFLLALSSEVKIAYICMYKINFLKEFHSLDHIQINRCDIKKALAKIFIECLISFTLAWIIILQERHRYACNMCFMYIRTFYW